MRRLVLAAVVAGAVLTATPASARDEVTCVDVATKFVTEFAPIYNEAGAPTIRCLDLGPDAGAGGYNNATNTVDINARLSKLAREVGVKPTRHNMVAYWRNAIAHEVGHAWAHATGAELRWDEYATIREFAYTDPAHPQEDFAETFALSLGWHDPPAQYTRHQPNGYYAFVLTGEPTDTHTEKLAAAGMLP